MKRYTPLILFTLLLAVLLVVLVRPKHSETPFSPVLQVTGQPLPIIAPPFEQADFIGRTVLVNFMASWCAPCRLENPLLLRLKAQGVTIYGVAFRDSQPALTVWLQQDGNPYTRFINDTKGEMGIAWGITGAPETFVVRDGKIINRIQGPISEEQVNAILADVK